MYQEENKRFKQSIRKMEKKYKMMVQANAKQEKEQLRRSLDMCVKEKDMYKRERENLNKDNMRLRKSMQELVSQSSMLQRQIQILEQQEDIGNDQRADSIKEQLDYEIDKLKRDLNIELEKSKRLENVGVDMKAAKEKAEHERNNVEVQLKNMAKLVQQLKDEKANSEIENQQLKNKLDLNQKEIDQLKIQIKNEPKQQVTPRPPLETSKVENASKASNDFMNEYHGYEDAKHKQYYNDQNYRNDTGMDEFYYDNYEKPSQKPAPKNENPNPIQNTQPVKTTRKEKPKVASQLFSDIPSQNSSTDIDSKNWTQNYEKPKNNYFDNKTLEVSTSSDTIQQHNLINTITSPTPVESKMSSQNATDFFEGLYHSSNTQPSEIPTRSSQANLQFPQNQIIEPQAKFEVPVQKPAQVAPPRPKGKQYRI